MESGERPNGRYITDLKALAMAQGELVKQVAGDDPFWRRKA
jgi:hypothetical protein